MKRNFKTLEEKIIHELQDNNFASEYLNDALHDPDPRMFLLALQDIYKARNKNISQITQKASLTKTDLNKLLSIKTNTKLLHMISLLNATGFSFSVQPLKAQRKSK